MADPGVIELLLLGIYVHIRVRQLAEINFRGTRAALNAKITAPGTSAAQTISIPVSVTWASAAADAAKWDRVALER